MPLVSLGRKIFFNLKFIEKGFYLISPLGGFTRKGVKEKSLNCPKKP